jgi:hypothetical protein
MKTGATALELLLIIIVGLHVGALLWPKRAGYHYLRYDLSKRGIRIRQIPPACLHEFVDDALHYARTVSAAVARSGKGEHRISYVEFERMLRIHSFVVHALLTGRTAAELDPFVDRTMMRELIRSEVLRAGCNPSADVSDRRRIEAEVHAGKCWDRHRSILCRHDLSTHVALVEIAPTSLNAEPPS